MDVYAQSDAVYAFPSKEIKNEELQKALKIVINESDNITSAQQLNDYFLKGRYYLVYGSLDSSRTIFKKIEEYAFKNKLTITQISATYYLARVEGLRGNNKESLNLLVKADKIAIVNRNFLFHNYIQLAIIELNRKQENYDLALNLLEQLRHNIYNQPVDTFALIEYNNRYAAVYNEMRSKSVTYLDSAIKYSEIAIELCKKIKSKGREALSYNELGFSYENKFEYKKAEFFYQKSADTYKEAKLDRNYLNTLNNLARIYQKQNRYVESNRLIDKIIPDLEKYNWHSLNAGVFRLKAENYEKLKKYDSAVYAYKTQYMHEKKMYMSLFDYDLLKEQNRVNIELLEAKIKELENDQISYKTWLKIILYLAIVLAVLLLFVFKNFRSKCKALSDVRAVNHQYLTKISELELQNRIEKEKVDKLERRIKDIMDVIE